MGLLDSLLQETTCQKYLICDHGCYQEKDAVYEG